VISFFGDGRGGNPASILKRRGPGPFASANLLELGALVTMLDIPTQENASLASTHRAGIRIIIALNPNGRALMKRDMELIRKILLEIESWNDTTPKIVDIDGYDSIIIGRHVELLYEANLIDSLKPFESGSTHDPATIFVKDISWSGHEFIDVLKNQSVWGKLKENFSVEELAGLPLSVLQNVGMALFNEWAKRQVGL
jgi:hypothetical protein